MAQNEASTKIIQNDTTVQTNSEGNKNKRYLDWDEYFMAIAFLAAKRSKDPRTQVGACIVNSEKRILGIGYNGMPTGCSDDEFPWGKDYDDKLKDKSYYVCHAEVNAILNKNCSDVRNCTIYVALFPCNECAKVIIQSGIKLVIYMSDKQAHKKKTIAAKRMFQAAGVQYRQYIPRNQKIVIDFSEIKGTSDKVQDLSNSKTVDNISQNFEKIIL
ncbi:deoxycytidylate deaminase isoform X1 [Megachile rotundata]|uniref:deoxycytidylate deaminase isoform X1 n=1 Tax=Megachile rotundata TaxID=143995 RepID=UPI0006150FFB|nr:PREDICTED: deoxycytidylate deaminase [Megachile rotundata]